MKYGYARVSTDDQNAGLQLAALKKAGAGKVFTCLKTLKSGDTLMVWKLDRLGRSLRDLIVMLDELKARGVKFQSLTEHIDTETPTGRAMWQMPGRAA
jgi:DNA invertase Pin-like site-specific DNA recombinase